LDGTDFVIFPSSLGNIILISREGRLIELSISKDGEDLLAKLVRQRHPSVQRNSGAFKAVRPALDRYLKGQRVTFDVPVDLSGQPAFTRTVLEEVKLIPFGEIRSYKWISERVGYLQGARAVGQAVARNPVPIIIPCHRVVRQNGSLGGFSMEGVSKAYLLGLEGVQLRQEGY
jgi:methylated-DNA-[protein]-cysteine S-methyltransferase